MYNLENHLFELNIFQNNIYKYLQVKIILYSYSTYFSNQNSYITCLNRSYGLKDMDGLEKHLFDLNMIR